MRRLSSFRERKYTFKQLDQVPAVLKDVTFAIQSPEVVAVVERITKIARQVPDPRLYAGGITLMAQGDFLNPHIDNSHDGERRLYRTLNLLYYVTPGWKPEYGGNLELWDDRVRSAVTLPSLFNRLVVMETNRHSWHSVSPVAHDGQRCCVSNYYFSARSPEGPDYFHVTSFSARPEQPVRRWIAAADNLARMGIRRIFRRGLGRRDVYRPEGPR
jgi:Rps23 Pro-64 3,4-dihydroxylase Tpa1-like proline 4-hydroxylase